MQSPVHIHPLKNNEAGPNSCVKLNTKNINVFRARVHEISSTPHTQAGRKPHKKIASRPCFPAAVHDARVQAQLTPRSRATLALVLDGSGDAKHLSSSARTGDKSPAWHSI
ncbi:unnamed protein product [Ectocarpus sp. 13 AM-2016]